MNNTIKGSENNKIEEIKIKNKRNKSVNNLEIKNKNSNDYDYNKIFSMFDALKKRGFIN